ncbi:hypothetical protein O7606_15975 [Micromonospora sp. WMMD882]|uniref:hypothetical protein n=1 Tax=Micromonospora sp. WMMD882 TaxID=3015151 RepID=UPI00248C899A|nr:hypothetical protein [Micromonospora sp. WMMD882]WBB77768.1 hypothetical protein O7606_15975 [Micromonospora sp. WMMD882]
MSIDPTTSFPDDDQPPTDPRPNGGPPSAPWRSAGPPPADSTLGGYGDPVTPPYGTAPPPTSPYGTAPPASTPSYGTPPPPPRPVPTPSYGTPPPPPPPPPPGGTGPGGGTGRPYPDAHQPSPGGRALPEPEPLPIPVASATTMGRRDRTIRIGLWGAGRAGKSTFLASLPLAAMQRSHDRWVVAGTNEAAAEYLGHTVHRLAVERRFPPPNQASEPISWSFHSSPEPSGPGSGLWSRLRRPAAEEVDFELEDPPGAWYQAGRINPVVIDNLANAAGLLYLVDPLHDPDSDPSFQFFFQALQFLTTRMAEAGQLRRGRLPHHLAVCVTKFDDERLFRRLVAETDLVTQDPYEPRLPRVPQERSAEYFDWVCDRVLGSGAAMVRDGLRAYFDPRRVAYFATSAVGFRLNRNQVFDFRDFRNIDSDDGEVRLRDRPRPINVLEPLIFLERRIRAERQR